MESPILSTNHAMVADYESDDRPDQLFVDLFLEPVTPMRLPERRFDYDEALQMLVHTEDRTPVCQIDFELGSPIIRPEAGGGPERTYVPIEYWTVIDGNMVWDEIWYID